MTVSIIISTYNRTKILDLVLDSLCLQNLSCIYEDVELIIVDDKSTEPVRDLLLKYKSKFNHPIKFIVVDSSKSKIPAHGHTPALTNNVGIRNASNDIVIIQGADVVHCASTNIVVAAGYAHGDLLVFGDVWNSSKDFTNYVLKESSNPTCPMSWNYNNWWDQPLARVSDFPRTGPYWYFMAARRDTILKIGGVDEEYLRGVFAEDDNFAYRLKMAGAREHRCDGIRALHMYHFDEKDEKHDRSSKKWLQAAQLNRSRWTEFLKNPQMIANQNYVWGSDEVVVSKEIL